MLLVSEPWCLNQGRLEGKVSEKAITTLMRIQSEILKDVDHSRSLRILDRSVVNEYPRPIFLWLEQQPRIRAPIKTSLGGRCPRPPISSTSLHPVSLPSHWHGIGNIFALDKPRSCRLHGYGRDVIEKGQGQDLRRGCCDYNFSYLNKMILRSSCLFPSSIFWPIV